MNSNPKCYLLYLYLTLNSFRDFSLSYHTHTPDGVPYYYNPVRLQPYERVQGVRPMAIVFGHATSTYGIQDITWLTHSGRVRHICVSKLTIIGSDNGLSPGRRQAIIWTSAGILLIGSLGTNFSEILIGVQTFSFKKMHLKMSSAKWRPFCPGLNVLPINLLIHTFLFFQESDDNPQISKLQGNILLDITYIVRNKWRSPHPCC